VYMRSVRWHSIAQVKMNLKSKKRNDADGDNDDDGYSQFDI